MAFHQSVEETMSDLICHMPKRTDKLNTGDQLAIFIKNTENGSKNKE